MARKRSFFVPRAVFGASFKGVVPACVIAGLQACSNSGPVGVAAVAYCCFEASLPDASDGGDASDAPADVTSDAPEDGSNDGADE